MAESPREALLVANRISELVESPIRGKFDLDHLRAVHAHIFQDLPHHRPGEVRADAGGWSKTRMLEGEPGGYDVHYAHTNIAGRADSVLQNFDGPQSLRALHATAVSARLASLYGDLDFIHSFPEGNSRTLRSFTRALAQEAGYKLDWAPTGADAVERNKLYVARDIAVLERAYPGLTPERGMATTDRYEYEASLALPGMRRRGVSLESVIRDGLSPLATPGASPTVSAAPATASVLEPGLGARAFEALARYRERSAAAAPEATSIADRGVSRPSSFPATAAPSVDPDRSARSPSRDPSPGF